jgi:hypothetical protein
MGCLKELYFGSLSLRSLRCARAATDVVRPSRSKKSLKKSVLLSEKGSQNLNSQGEK